MCSPRCHRVRDPPSSGLDTSGGSSLLPSTHVALNSCPRVWAYGIWHAWSLRDGQASARETGKSTGSLYLLARRNTTTTTSTAPLPRPGTPRGEPVPGPVSGTLTSAYESRLETHQFMDPPRLQARRT